MGTRQERGARYLFLWTLEGKINLCSSSQLVYLQQLASCPYAYATVSSLAICDTVRRRRRSNPIKQCPRGEWGELSECVTPEILLGDGQQKCCSAKPHHNKLKHEIYVKVNEGPTSQETWSIHYAEPVNAVEANLFCLFWKSWALRRFFSARGNNQFSKKGVTNFA